MVAYDGNTMPDISGASLRKMKNMVARLRERAAFAPTITSRANATKRLRYVEDAIRTKYGSEALK